MTVFNIYDIYRYCLLAITDIDLCYECDIFFQYMLLFFISFHGINILFPKELLNPIWLHSTIVFSEVVEFVLFLWLSYASINTRPVTRKGYSGGKSCSLPRVCLCLCQVWTAFTLEMTILSVSEQTFVFTLSIKVLFSPLF